MDQKVHVFRSGSPFNTTHTSTSSVLDAFLLQKKYCLEAEEADWPQMYTIDPVQ